MRFFLLTKEGLVSRPVPGTGITGRLPDYYHTDAENLIVGHRFLLCVVEKKVNERTVDHFQFVLPAISLLYEGII